MISTENNIGAARLILEENILGGSCARVCPTETLCEQSCVRNDQDQRPVSIGLLQRHAVDAAMAADKQFFERAADTGKRIAIVGAGPASLSCAHGLACKGHSVTILEACEKNGGLNEYGLAAYKMLDDFASREIEYILAIGNIDIRYGQRLGADFDLVDLQSDYDAVFLGIGLSDFMDSKGIESVDEIIGKAVKQVTDWRYLGLNTIVKAEIDQDSCIQCGRCHVVCEDTSHQAISQMKEGRRHFEVLEEECVGCNLCVSVCPVETCITLRELSVGEVDARTGKMVSGEYANWTTHENNTMRAS